MRIAQLSDIHVLDPRFEDRLRAPTARGVVSQRVTYDKERMT